MRQPFFYGMILKFNTIFLTKITIFVIYIHFTTPPDIPKQTGYRQNSQVINFKIK